MIQNDDNSTIVRFFIILVILIIGGAYFLNIEIQKQKEEKTKKENIEKISNVKSNVYNEKTENSEKFVKIEDSYVGGFKYNNIKVDKFYKGELKDGYYLVQIRIGKSYYNLMNQNGAVIFKNWSEDRIEEFSDGYAQITKEDTNYNRTYNFIDIYGDFLFDEWLDYHSVFDFSEGYAFVNDNETRSCNVINTKGELQLKKWIDGCFGAVQTFKDGKEELYIQRDGRSYYNILLRDEMEKFFYKDSIYQIDLDENIDLAISKGWLRVMNYENGRTYNIMKRNGELVYDWTEEKPEY